MSQELFLQLSVKLAFKKIPTNSFITFYLKD